jgi:hypothetical protein
LALFEGALQQLEARPPRRFITTISPSIHAEARPSLPRSSASERRREVQSLPLRVKRLHVLALHARDDAIAVELDLVDPAFALGRIVDQGSELWREEEGSFARTASLGGLDSGGEARVPAVPFLPLAPRFPTRAFLLQHAFGSRLDDVVFGGGARRSSSSLMRSQPPGARSRALSCARDSSGHELFAAQSNFRRRRDIRRAGRRRESTRRDPDDHCTRAVLAGRG